MKIIATSDLHGDLPLDVPECDLFIIAGDSCPVRGSHAVDVQAYWFVKHFIPWLKGVPAKHKVFIGGNHDFLMEDAGFPALLRTIDLPDNIHYLQDSGIQRTLDGPYIYGMPWVPNLPTWAFPAQIEDSQEWDYLTNHQGRMPTNLGDKIAAIPTGADIVISHGPPEGILDKVLFSSHPHVGAQAMPERMQKVNPALYICGHIHESYGVKQAGDTLYANVAQMDRSYNPINPMVEFDLQQEDGKWVVKGYSQVEPEVEVHHNED
jgi:hypothetical protein